ncbi:MAG: hypothetical protein K9H64_21255 [Bacteroidales bacterium]|nr:hypothetical protein [Bacteroidales bacterium]MCF8458568.1 hypothetical protein [Bacteroidales bacterium]
MNILLELENSIPALKKLQSRELIYSSDNCSYAGFIAKSQLPYSPGIYLVFNYDSKNYEDLLYVGKAGVDKSGRINAHQLPKRLLATIVPPEKYRQKSFELTKKYLTRVKAWPIMMDIDEISTIKIVCYFSEINIDCVVNEQFNPVFLEKKIRDVLNDLDIIPYWIQSK